MDNRVSVISIIIKEEESAGAVICVLVCYGFWTPRFSGVVFRILLIGSRCCHTDTLYREYGFPVFPS